MGGSYRGSNLSGATETGRQLAQRGLARGVSQAISPSSALGPWLRLSIWSEPEFDDIAVGHDVVLAFEADLSLGASVG